MTDTILLVRLSALGDVIFTLPALEAIKRVYPGASISWLVEDKASSLLIQRKDIERVLVYPRKEINKCLRNPFKWPRLLLVLAKHLGRLRSARYDLILDFQGNLKSGIHTMLARGKNKIGFSRGHVKELNNLFTRGHVTPPQNAHRIEKNMCLADPVGWKTGIKRPELHIPDDLIREAEKSILRLRSSNNPLIVVHPGTSAFGAFKRWPPERFGMLARRLKAERGVDTLITWGPDERSLAEAAAEAAGGDAIISPPSRSLLHLAAFISLGSAYVSADSGPLHLANYLGIPCLALFGPKDPALYRPYFSPCLVARAGVECSPCSKRRCDDPICMEKLDVDDVYKALCELLYEERDPPPSLGSCSCDPSASAS